MQINKQNILAQKFFPQKLYSEHILKQASSNKCQAECLFQMDQIVDISSLKDSSTDQPKVQTYLQIRGEFVVQVYKSKVKRGTKLINKDQFVCGFHIQPNISFQIKRQYQQSSQSLAMPVGIVFYFNEHSFEIQLLSSESSVKIEKFGQVLESKKIVQKNFHKIFKPIRKLGKGASATVVEGQDLRNGILYAVKGFKKSRGFSAYKGIFLKELESMKELYHPNIVKLYSIFETDNSLYMIMEKYEQNLYSYLTSNGLTTQYQLKAIMKGILQILSYLHAKGIMHRDIKPQNIMIIEGEYDKKQLLKRKTNIEPVLIDFGFSENQNSQEFVLHRCGTPGFVAPEILKNYKVSEQAKDSFNSQISVSKRRYTKSCDIFSLGCLFHIMLTNRMLFSGVNRKQLIKKNIEAKIDDSHKDYKLMDISARRLLFRMLEIDPEKRITADQALKHQFFNLQMFNFKPISFKIELPFDTNQQISKQDQSSVILHFQ